MKEPNEDKNEQKLNDLEENWWNNGLMENKADINKLKSTIIENDKPFEIDYELKIKKRNYYSIENDILNNLYGKKDFQGVPKK